jgi:hypothetical protein
MVNTDSILWRVRINRLLFLITIGFFISGCSGLVNTEQPSIANWVTLSSGQTLGQTFVARYNGLTGVYFYLSPHATGNGEIKLHLRASPQSDDDLAVSMNSLRVDAVKASGFYGFFLPPQTGSNQKYFYAFLEVAGTGDLLVGNSSGETYLNGAEYQNGASADTQTAFRLSYSRKVALLGLLSEALSLGWRLIVAVFLYFLPGWGLFSLLWPGWGKFSWPEKVGLAGGLSLALYPLLILWTDLIGIRLGAIYAWLPALAGLGMLLWRNRKELNSRSLFRRRKITTSWADLTFVVILSMVIVSRFWAVRSIAIPMWGDSYQHTVIAQLLVDNGGLFTSWQPYAAMTTFTYHFGFHAAVAVFNWITHMDIPSAVLWVGQFLNVMAVTVLYPLAIRIGRNRWAGVVAVMIAGLLAPMPMFYTNWGRYTQLAGQVILPVAVLLMWITITSSSNETGKIGARGMVAISCLAIGGLALTHYRVLILAMIFLLALWILYARRGTFLSMLRKTFWVGIGGGLLFLPWFIRVFGGKILNIVAHQMAIPAAQAVESNPQLAGIGNILIFLPAYLWLVLPFLVGIGILRRERDFLVVVFWWVGNLLAGNPSWLGLPGAGAITGFAVFIGAYIPAGILIGASATWLRDLNKTGFFHKPRVSRIFSSAGLLLIIGLSLWGASQRLKDLHPEQFSLATQPDMQAANWIRENTPADAHILVNSFAAYSNSVIVGSDGGWWLPLLARRQTTVPPLLYSSEQSPSTNYISKINALTFEIQKKGIESPDIYTQLEDRDISYLYIGQLQGNVNSGGPLFSPAQLISDSNFSLVYHQDRVWIFKTIP